MLVDVVPMRRRGEKLPGEEVRATPPVRGRLVFVTIDWRQDWRPHVPKEPTTFARLLVEPPPTSAADPLFALPELRDGRFTKWDGRQGVIVGIEEDADAQYARDRPQAWWVRATAR